VLLTRQTATVHSAVQTVQFNRNYCTCTRTSAHNYTIRYSTTTAAHSSITADILTRTVALNNIIQYKCRYLYQDSCTQRYSTFITSLQHNSTADTRSRAAAHRSTVQLYSWYSFRTAHTQQYSTVQQVLCKCQDTVVAAHNSKVYYK
jgi:hypothetical protein